MYASIMFTKNWPNLTPLITRDFFIAEHNHRTKWTGV